MDTALLRKEIAQFQKSTSMPVTFDTLTLGGIYDRPQLAKLWGYKAFQAIAKGIVTPASDNKIILFVTVEKQSFLTQYKDSLVGDRLEIEGETDHRADARIVNAATRGDQIHVFYRERHHSPFTYCGEALLVESTLHSQQPSHFVFRLGPQESVVAQSSLLTEDQTHGFENELPGDEEGTKRLRQHIVYERSVANRAQAIKIHGTVCLVCGFDFDAVYGSAYARHYIEIHHVKSVTEGVRVIDPKKDLVPLCSNCHSMAHRNHGTITSVADLKQLLRKCKAA